jgi:hypothetical protein
MNIDRQLLFSDEQAVTTTAVSTDKIDLGRVGREVGAGEEMWLYGIVEEAATASGSATVTFDLNLSAAADLSSPTTVFSTGAIGKATLIVGYEFFRLRLPILPVNTTLRYLGINYTVATGPLTAGKFTAFLSRDVSAWRGFANNFPQA